MTYEEQIAKLYEKKLVINNVDYAIELLKDHSYFGLINGYKKQFKCKTGDYKSRTTIEDIYSLYVFDDSLRTLFLQYILKIEKYMKSRISYIFCQEYGESQHAYLDKNNYNCNKYTEKSIEILIQAMQDVLKTSKNYAYIEHQKRTYNNVPLWVLVKALTFGKISKLYNFLPQRLQNTVRKEFPGIRENELLKMLEILTHCRNVCAHNERLYDHSFRKSTIYDTNVHSMLQLPKRGKQFIKGKNDLFAVVIVLKYLLKKDEFSAFFNQLTVVIETLFSSTTQIPQEQLFRHMGFPHNWRDIESISVK